MSRFPKSDDDTPKDVPMGIPMTGAFECDECGQVATQAYNVRKEQKLYWECPQGHVNSITFRF